MSLGVSRTTEPLRFDTGIGNASFAEIIDAPGAGQPQRSLLPGSTTVTQAVDNLFPVDKSVEGELMSAMVEHNTVNLRTSSGFSSAAHSVLKALRNQNTPSSDAAAHEIEILLADTDLFERYRMSLLES